MFCKVFPICYEDVSNKLSRSSILFLNHKFRLLNAQKICKLILSTIPSSPLIRCATYRNYHSKKDVNEPYPLAYNPQDVEKGWYDYWDNLGLFQPKIDPKNGTAFSIVLPPPNVTGNLHLGHTLTAAIEDTICRWHRMKGNNVIWVPGYDHGGIATQAVVEKKIFKEKKLNRHQLGKEQFLSEVQDWSSKTRQTIESQLKKMGCSLDFNRSTFTMDSNTSVAVNQAFIQLFEENLIYRKKKMVNWSCAIKSVISDVEVDHIEVPGNSKLRIPGLPNPIDVGFLEYFTYPLCDSDEKLLIATTRLETMLGDTALAVNPSDTRYSNFVGQQVLHPFTQRKIPIIADETITKEFGTGIMKVTPAHDFIDYEIAVRHGLDILDIYEDDGTLKNEVDQFGGKHRFEARKLVQEKLSELGLYVERKPHSLSIPICSRTGDIVEPRLKSQWYLNCSTMAKEAVAAAEEKRLKFLPDFQVKNWFEWFKKLQDWCISRQLMWGHQIPAYRIYNKSLSEIDEQWVAATDNMEAMEKAAKKLQVDIDSITVVQDEDVLDTWFSSALFPLTALGWPKNAEDLNKFYPLSLMETGYDIMFFWVARMVMLGQHFTGKLPFNEVLLHGMVCDSHGRKMTKSLGNVLDPADIIYGISVEKLCERAENSFKQGSLSPEELTMALNSYRRSYPTGIPECGTDALRFALLTHDVQQQRINMDIKHIRVCRHFCNKIWQGVRLFVKTVENLQNKREFVAPLLPQDVSLKVMSEVDQWILSRLSRLVSNVDKGIGNYEFHTATYAMRQFWVQNFCDVYLEYIKGVVQSGDESAHLLVSRVMLTCIEVFLRATSPVMPFLTEELYQRLSHIANIKDVPSITAATFPQPNVYSAWRNTVLEADMTTALELVNIARSLKSQHGATKIKPTVTIVADEESTLAALSKFGPLMVMLARLESVAFHTTQGQEFFESEHHDAWVMKEHEHGITVIMETDVHLEPSKSNVKRVNEIKQELGKLSKMMSDSGYRKKAALSVQQKHLAKKATLESELQKLSTIQSNKLDTDTKEEEDSVSQKT